MNKICFEETIQKCINELNTVFKEHNKSLGPRVVTALSPPQQYDTSDESTTSSPCEEFNSRRDRSPGGDYGLQANTIKQNVGTQQEPQFKPLISDTAVICSKDSRLAPVEDNITVTGPSGMTAGSIKSESTMNSSVHLKKETVARATEFRLPDIKFSGAAHFDKLRSIRTSSVQLLSEGLLVDQFIVDFESQLKLSNLNIDCHWFDLLEVCFKEVKNTRLSLYVWFKKRFHEGLSWDRAQQLLRTEFGFGSPASCVELKNQFLSLKQYPGEHFQEFYSRFRPYAIACHKSNVFPEEKCFIIYHFLTNIISQGIRNYLCDVLCKMFQKKRQDNTLPCPESYYANINLTALSKIPSSWLEFDQTITDSYLTFLINIDTQEHNKAKKIDANGSKVIRKSKRCLSKEEKRAIRRQLKLTSSKKTGSFPNQNTF